MCLAVILAIEKDRFDLIKYIERGYTEIIAQDPSLYKYLEKIVSVYFDKALRPPSMIEQMMSSMFS